MLIGAHYDSVIAAPCADDNAAAVAIALRAATVLRSRPIERDVIIAIFDAEEPPYFLGESMGSVRFYEDQLLDKGIHAAIIMDMVGHDVVIPFTYLEANRFARCLGRVFPRSGRGKSLSRSCETCFSLRALRAIPPCLASWAPHEVRGG